MEFIISFLSEWGYLALFICMALENMNIPIPSEIILRHTQKGGMGAKKMIAAKNWFETYGGIAVFTGRLLPGIRTFISLPAGIAQFSLPEFTILTIVGTIPWTIFLVYMGAMLGENWHSLLSYKLEIALVCIVICAIIAAAFHFYQKHKNNKHEAQ